MEGETAPPVATSTGHGASVADNPARDFLCRIPTYCEYRRCCTEPTRTIKLGVAQGAVSPSTVYNRASELPLRHCLSGISAGRLRRGSALLPEIPLTDFLVGPAQWIYSRSGISGNKSAWAVAPA